MSDSITSTSGTISAGERKQLAIWRQKIGTHLRIKRTNGFLNYYWHKLPKNKFLNFAEVKNIYDGGKIGWNFLGTKVTDLDTLGITSPQKSDFGPAVEVTISDGVVASPGPAPDRPDKINIDPKIPYDGHPGGGNENENGHNKNFPHSENPRRLIDI